MYEFDGSAWHERAKLISDDAEAGDSFGHAVAVHGARVVVGAPADDSGAGAAYVFEFDGNEWSQAARLFASDREAGDAFGYVLALDGDTFVVGSLLGGAAYVYTRSGSTWSSTTKLVGSDTTDVDLFGSSVAVSGTGPTHGGT